MVRPLPVVAAVLIAATPAHADPGPAEQWAAAPEAVLDLPGAWRVSQGADVVVAVVDSGVRLDHPELRANAWVNPAERPGNGVDDDGNGYVDDIHGVNLSGSGARDDLRDLAGHGTHVAGTIAAAADGRGVIGVAYRAKVMAIKVLDRRGIGSTKTMAAGIRYATANGARIINLSLETATDDPRVRAAVQAAARAGVLIVCSAGNHAQDVDRQPLFPVSIAAPNLVGVAATAPADGLAVTRFSNYGSLSVPVAAPGEAVVSTARQGGYETRSGTSMAAPHVAGVAALMAAANPRLGAAALRALLLEHAVRPPAAGGPGRVEALHSVQAALRAADDPLGQPPAIRILAATRRAGVIRAQYAVDGSRAAVAAVRVRLDGRAVLTLQGAGSPRAAILRGFDGTRVSVEALDSGGQALAAATAALGPVAAGPPPLRLSGSSAAGAEVAARLAARGAGGGPRVSLVGGGTGMGIGDVARGIVDAGLASRPIFPSDPPGLVFTPFAHREGCLVSNGDAAQPPPEGVAGAAPAEFLEDLGTTPGASFATSAEAAAHVRATPGAWGFVDPPHAEGLTVRACRTYPLGLVTRGAPRGALARLAATLISADGRAAH